MAVEKPTFTIGLQSGKSHAASGLFGTPIYRKRTSYAVVPGIPLASARRRPAFIFASGASHILKPWSSRWGIVANQSTENDKTVKSVIGSGDRAGLNSRMVLPLFSNRPVFPALLGLLFAGLLALTPLGDACAATSDWATSDGGRMRLIVLPPAPDGTRQAGLQIEPNDGWFTYWREPGDSGIPPQLTAAPEAKVTPSPLSFPVPKRMDIGSVRDVGYDHAVVFPFTLKSSGEDWQSPLKLTAFIGMCRNICIPFQADLSIDLSHEETTDVGEVKLIDKAKSKLPAAAAEDFYVSDFEMAHDLSSLDVSLVLPDGSKDEPRILVTGPEGYLFTEYKAVQSKGNSRTLRIALPKFPRNYSVSGKTWHILVAAGNKRTMEAPLAFATTRPIVQP
ncbi:hypothetical protein GOZ96_10175 [Agrobacterium vitis]|nr:hypothetical protein DXM22_02720 [Agrobacterium vitis]MCF1475974.1 hypothetical protein [Agrobacterium vitis]MUZ96968.1 hypothetical protein [Agrobacterium vitis]MVA29141.1 hypothetical protein [Agrobacterium vitis]